MRSTGVLSFLLAMALFGHLPAAGQTQLPESKGAPKVGQTTADFILPDSNGKPFRLSEALSAKDAAGKRVKGLLLIVYRGYW